MTISIFYGVGINQYNIDLKYKTLHAEVDAINNLKINKKKRKKNVNMFVFRVTKNKKIVNSKPCRCCLNNLYKNFKKKNYNCKKIWYVNEQNNFDFIYLKNPKVWKNFRDGGNS